MNSPGQLDVPRSGRHDERVTDSIESTIEHYGHSLKEMAKRIEELEERLAIKTRVVELCRESAMAAGVVLRIEE